MADLILNRYKPMEEAGRGGFGTVIVAWDTRMRRKVAIKQIALGEKALNGPASKSTQIIYEDENATRVIKKDKKQDKGKMVDEAGEHWEDNIPGLSEARTAAMLQDANIVTVHDFELEDNNAYIIMEYVEGMTLTQFLDKYGNDMTFDMLTCIFAGISHALEVAHSENVLHLDIKPDNVLIDSKGKVKVTDFGLATLADEFGYGTANAGTIGYMPPEQMRRSALDVRSDLWALACITYEMLCGKNPFDAKDLQTSLRKTEDAKLICPSSCWEDCDENLDDTIFKALDPDPNNRYDSVAEFSKDMSECLANPRAGQKQLSALFTNQDKAEEESQPRHAKSRILEGLTNNIGQTILGRAFAVLCSAPLALLAIFNLSFCGTGNLNLIGIILLSVMLIAAAAWPPLGLGAASIAFSLALLMSGNYIIAGTLIFFSIIWMVYSFKLSVSNTNCAGSYSFFGCFGFSQFAPFVTGLFCEAKEAVINTVFGFVNCVILAGLGSSTLIGWEPQNYIDFSSNYGLVQDNVLQIIQKPGTWIWFISWVATALVIAICFRFSYRSLHVISVIAGMVIMIIGICVANYFTSDMLSWQAQGWEILPTILAGGSAVIISIFLPNRQ